MQAYETIAAVNVASDSLRVAHSEFVKSERPLVTTAISRVTHKSRCIFVEVVPHNYGKTPAIHPRTLAGVFLKPQSPLAVADQFFANLDADKMQKLPTSFLPPRGQQEVFSTLVSPELSSDQARQFLHTDDGLLVVGREQYEDASGNVYHTDYCFRRLATGAMLHCERHNDFE